MLKQLSKYFGIKALGLEKYVDYTMKDEHWSGGCYAAVYGKETWTTCQHDLRMPEGRIFFAGTETSDVWFGYIEGAVRAGERAANEVLGIV
jgi:monoamine oxidase